MTARVALGVVCSIAAIGEASARVLVTHADAQRGLSIVLLAAATTVPLVLLAETSAAAAMMASTIVSLVLFHTFTVGGLVGVIVALFLVGRSRAELVVRASRRTHSVPPAPLLAAPLVAVAMVLVATQHAGTEAWLLTLSLIAAAPTAAVGGTAARARSEAAVQGVERQIIAGTMLEHAARGERARIARELHDVVAHHISMVAVQAETARLTTPGMPPAGAARLSAIGDTARSALTEMRRLLGVLREDAGDDVPERRPQPGIAQLIDLLDEARSVAGTGARLILSGSPVDADPGVELAAYRIAQEALTNARRHAPGAAVDVELHYTGTALRLRIRDNGPGPTTSSATPGHGLVGMRERAIAVGGMLRTGPAAGGGFVVETTLPLVTLPLVTGAGE